VNETLFVLILLAQSACWAVAGWMLCSSRHQERGIAVDRFDGKAGDPLPPDIYVPAEWNREKVDA
jgi:hypothetical protein